MGMELLVGDWIISAFVRKGSLDMRYGEVIDILGTKAMVQWVSGSPGAILPKKPTEFDAGTGRFLIFDGLRNDNSGFEVSPEGI